MCVLCCRCVRVEVTGGDGVRVVVRRVCGGGILRVAFVVFAPAFMALLVTFLTILLLLLLLGVVVGIEVRHANNSACRAQLVASCALLPHGVIVIGDDAQHPIHSLEDYFERHPGFRHVVDAVLKHIAEAHDWIRRGVREGKRQKEEMGAGYSRSLQRQKMFFFVVVVVCSIPRRSKAAVR